MAEYMMPAPGEGAGSEAGLTKTTPSLPNTPNWARREISNRNYPGMLRAATGEALRWAATVHEIDCEDRWPGTCDVLPSLSDVAAVAAIQRRANPMLLMRYLPPDATDAVRGEAERMLRGGSRTWSN